MSNTVVHDRESSDRLSLFTLHLHSMPISPFPLIIYTHSLLLLHYLLLLYDLTAARAYVFSSLSSHVKCILTSLHKSLFLFLVWNCEGVK